eukprot:2506721-Rhodomonas_salina.4
MLHSTRRGVRRMVSGRRRRRRDRHDVGIVVLDMIKDLLVVLGIFVIMRDSKSNQPVHPLGRSPTPLGPWK